jgi:hypothetical protein
MARPAFKNFCDELMRRLMPFGVSGGPRVFGFEAQDAMDVAVAVRKELLRDGNVVLRFRQDALHNWVSSVESDGLSG